MMAYTTLEDYFGDIVSKARRGQSKSEAELASAVGITAGDIAQIEAYKLTPDDDQIRALAEALNLDGDKLVGIAKGWVPAEGNASYEDEQLAVERLILSAGIEVNAYVLKCKTTGHGAIIDAGGQARRILDLVQQMEVSVNHILVTHGHGDHVGALQEVADATEADVFCSSKDFPLLGGLKELVSEVVEDGWQTAVGELLVDAVSLPGHTVGGIGYGTGSVFFSGDALFAGSLGGARGTAYAGQIKAVQEKVLCRDEKTKIFPGHGPITSIANELAHNPFFV